jgi:four helix bundle protein
MRDYTKIEAWKRSDDLTVAIYERTRTFPKKEIYGLTAQLRRAAYSVPANIIFSTCRIVSAMCRIPITRFWASR